MLHCPSQRRYLVVVLLAAVVLVMAATGCGDGEDDAGHAERSRPDEAGLPLSAYMDTTFDSEG